MSQIAHTSRGPIEYTWQGEGPVILIVHGGHANCHETFGYAALLAAGFSILTPSRPGYGQTPVAVGPTAVAAADAMLGLLDVLQIAQVSVIAISAGGPTGLQLAARYPTRINKLVLESAVTQRWLTPADPVYRLARRLFHPRIEKITWFMLRVLARIAPRLAASQMVGSFSTLPVTTVMQQLSTAEINAIGQMIARQTSGHGFMLDLDHEVDTSVLQSIVTPTLVIHSHHDNSVPFAHALHAQAQIAGAELFAAQTWGHLLWLGEGAPAVERNVIDFLRQVSNNAHNKEA